MRIEEIKDLKSTYLYTYQCKECGKEAAQKGMYLKKKKELICPQCLKKRSNINAYLKRGDDIKEKRKATCMEKYGVESFSQTSSFKEKAEQTSLERYGVKNPHQSLEVVEKGKHTSKERYGTENVMQNPLFVEKMRATNLATKGVEWSSQTDEAKEKSKSTNEERYGVPYYTQSQKNREGVEKSQILKRIERFKKIDFSLLPIDYLEEKDEKGNINTFLICKKCGHKWIGVFDREKKISTLDSLLRCSQCEPVVDKLTSENNLKAFINSLSPYRFDKTKKILSNKRELDLYNDQLKLAIEFDGIYTHSEGYNRGGKDKSYHLSKTEECLKKGIKLIHLWENEWIQKRILVEDILKGILVGHTKVYARKCVVKIITKEYKLFCEENHLQGFGSAEVRLGLFYQDELVQAMSFSKSRFNKNYEWEMIRECSKKGIVVVGGKGKLLKHFERNYKPSSLISYCDRRWFTGESYLKLGFKLEKTTPPGYWYFKNSFSSDGFKLYHRTQFQKHKLPQLLPRFDSQLTEWENMQLNGYNRIWDCGQLVFVK
jgi:hypothetical protein